jgi:hypothetical protein
VTARRAWLPAVAVLAIAYLGTLAPSVTFWDAGEFIAAAHSLGIPHPPGTPLFILLLHVWGSPWPDERYAFALNLASAAATLAAAGLSATMIFRWLSGRWDSRAAVAAATAAAICAGAMYTVWSNATETEVYAASLALAALMLVAGDRAGAGKRDGQLLLCYLFGLAAALHASALVAAPAAIVLAIQDERDDVRLARGLSLVGGAALAMGIGTWSAGLRVIGLVFLSGFVVASRRDALAAARSTVAVASVVLLGASPILFMLVRAKFDPGINQGNPETWRALADVVARRQYDLAPLWPRRAPFWIQIGNWFEYADWQVALSLGPGVVPTTQRTVVTLLFAALAFIGAVEHRRADRRSWRALLVLFLSGTIGVACYLNLRASPSFGWGVLPDGAVREARERDYFFVLGFWACGLWAGIGAVSLAVRRKIPVLVGVVAASVPVVLNWSAVSRRSEPDAHLARAIGVGLIQTLPERAVLFVAGDNDTYPVWFAREVLGLRRDVALVTVPLVGADWYVDELIRRNPDLAAARTSDGTSARTIADAARAAGRPVAASITLEESDRIQLNGCWRVSGLALLDNESGDNCLSQINRSGADSMPVDSARISEWIRTQSVSRVGAVKPSVDPVAEYFARALDCPREMLGASLRTRSRVSLDSTCKL